MSDEEHTHRVRGTEHYRTTESDGGAGGYAVYEPGDPITPTEGELDAAPERFEPIGDGAEQGDAESDESGGESETSTDTAEGTDESDDDESDAEGYESGVPTPEQVEVADYNELRSMAAEFEDVNGNWGGDRLRAELLDRVSE